MDAQREISEQRLKYRDILYGDDQLGPFPTQLLKRVPRPTSEVVGPIERRDPRESVFARSARGDFGEEIQRQFRRMTGRYPLGAALVDLQRHIAAVSTKRVEVAPRRAPIPRDPRVLSRHLKSLGYFLGADIMAVARLPQSAVYTHRMNGEPIDARLRYAIVFVNRKHEPTIRASNGWEQIVDPASFQAYQRLALQTEVAADYIRRLGWAAEPSHMYDYLTLMPQILLEAGIGEVCRMGIVLNPFLGTNFKSACVLTDLELETDGPVDFGLQDYCANCDICARQCPAGAIARGEQVVHNGYRTWKLNAEACSRFAVLNKEGCVCGRCTKVCPWHRPDSEPRDFAGWDGGLDTLHRSVDAQRRRLIENDCVDPLERTHKWWFELDELPDGTLSLPSDRNTHKVCRRHPLAKEPCD
ncbi:MAG: 4Fe-4S dicluster domain-containing protein [Burkholderiales bacterium]|nr:4Fe-4S dicluster domain-containing protein [Burkholderiales bacterium]